jgi:hypothetical protein
LGLTVFQKNKYLENLGLKKEDYGLNWLSKDDDRLKDFNDEKEMYGFCSAETWNMGRIFCEWLYSHCKMYLEKAEGIVDMEFHCIEIDGEEVTQLQCIQRIIKLTGEALTESDGLAVTMHLKKAILIWAEVFPLMWW